MKRVTLVAASRHSRTVSTGGTACHSGPRGLVYQVRDVVRQIMKQARSREMIPPSLNPAVPERQVAATVHPLSSTRGSESALSDVTRARGLARPSVVACAGPLLSSGRRCIY